MHRTHRVRAARLTQVAREHPCIHTQSVASCQR
eukprot:SAG25_NODE_14319_length_256_cov_0.764331_1_plen_32_part_10